MRPKQLRGIVVVVAGISMWLAGNVAPLSAHHAFAAEFDAERPVEFTGTVTKVEWINPHVWIHLDVNKDGGATESWAFEAGTPNVLFRRGFTRRSLLPGTEGHGGRISGEGRDEPCEWPGYHLRRRDQAVPGLIGHRRSLRTGPTGRRHRRSLSLKIGAAQRGAPEPLRPVATMIDVGRVGIVVSESALCPSRDGFRELCVI